MGVLDIVVGVLSEWFGRVRLGDEREAARG
jgi:hypothetical protein